MTAGVDGGGADGANADPAQQANIICYGGADPRRIPRTTTSKRRIQRRVTPLEILQQPLEAASRKVFDLRKFLLVLGATGLVLLLPTPPGPHA